MGLEQQSQPPQAALLPGGISPPLVTSANLCLRCRHGVDVPCLRPPHSEVRHRTARLMPHPVMRSLIRGPRSLHPPRLAAVLCGPRGEQILTYVPLGNPSARVLFGVLQRGRSPQSSRCAYYAQLVIQQPLMESREPDRSWGSQPRLGAPLHALAPRAGPTQVP